MSFINLFRFNSNRNILISFFYYISTPTNYIKMFLISSSYFTNFLGIFRIKEIALLTLCVRLPCVPSVFNRVPRAVSPVWCVYGKWAPIVGVTGVWADGAVGPAHLPEREEGEGRENDRWARFVGAGLCPRISPRGESPPWRGRQLFTVSAHRPCGWEIDHRPNRPVF